MAAVRGMRPAWRAGLLAAAGAAFIAYGSGAVADPSHEWAQTPPIELGTTGANVQDLYLNLCCTAGTLGALVTDGPNDYVLSNNHVLARVNDAAIGEATIHPSTLDQVCTLATYNDPHYYDNDVVAVLSGFVPISFTTGTVNRVDAGAAVVVNGAVNSSGSILDIGVPDWAPAAATVDMKVTKSGRTTGRTSGKVVAVNVTVDVRYTTACGGDIMIARFVEQIRIRGGKGLRKVFSAGGDSGSVILTDDDEFRPVGLLFAGSTFDTIANPMNAVLSELGTELGRNLTFVGQDNPSAGGGGGGTKEKGPPPGKGKNKNLAVGLQIASDVKARHRDSLFALPGVVGTGVSVDDAGNPVIEVYLDRAARDVQRPIPSEIEGIPVRTVVTGPITAY